MRAKEHFWRHTSKDQRSGADLSIPSLDGASWGVSDRGVRLA
jgi:hypothetical protein